ncbi:MAG TPA: T9SS type A sorting domain-containing protein [Flavobacteriales bacterium]|nr:T9SS type A sorting domain-containing protein [Flavobacteriales bacterium]
MISRVPGEHFDRSTCDTLSPGPAGPAQTWDFSALVGCGVARTYNWVAPIANPNFPYSVKLAYPSASIADYFTTTPDLFQQVVYGPLPNDYWIYDDPGDVVHYPMSYGDQFTDSFSGERTAVAGELFHGTRTVRYDAYGTALMPWGEETNVFRLYTRDTMLVPMEEFRNYVRDTYEFFIPDMHDPLVRITYTYTMDGMNSSGYTSVYVQATTGVTELDARIAATLAPNPVAGTATVRTTAPVISVTAVDMTGRTIALPFTPHGDILELDLHSLAAGSYSLLLRTLTGVTPMRFVKE